MSLDETPQLINVLLGQMSFVGPRPLLCSYLPYYTQKERLRSKVRPGITGLAQVNGRNTLTWNERLALDVVYVENFNFNLDCKILFKTILQVFTAKGLIIDPGSELANLDDTRKNKS
jgi:lipopolysaccharide/colanic/teichoic acid biosynthesis glycosyltransferase